MKTRHKKVVLDMFQYLIQIIGFMYHESKPAHRPNQKSSLVLPAPAFPFIRITGGDSLVS